MKTKKLIEILQHLDPAGEYEVTIHGKNLHDVLLLPGQSCGYYEKIYYDAYGEPEYGVITDEKFEIRLTEYSLSEIIFDKDSMPGGYFPACVVHHTTQENQNTKYKWAVINNARTDAAKYKSNQREKEAKWQLEPAHDKSSWKK